MKVVLFCGGLGTRLRDMASALPKPMVNIGYRPILWHIMKYYAHYGHKDFILCLGYKADVIKQFFLNYDQCLSSDFTLSNGNKQVHLKESDISDWKVTFVDTGLNSNIGQRLKPSDKIACFVCVKPSQSFSVVSVGKEGSVDQIDFVRDTNLLINGGYFVFRKDIFQYIKEGVYFVAYGDH